MLQRKRNLLSASLASAIILAAPLAFAQETPEADEEDATELDRITVTGMRSSIEKSIDTKQTSTSIIEAVSAEDIGKLPDSSIAESLARLPGLTAQRERGRASQINIRGFAGDFSATTLNGREQATTFDNRGVEFDQYPSELLSSVVVYKTPDASLVGQGLSGTVDLRTVRPLDHAERVFSIGARYDRNKIRGQEEDGFRYNLAYVDQFADGKLGVSIGFAHMDSPQPGYQNEPWGYTAFRGDPSLQVLGGSKFFKFNANNKRDGVMATIQLRPNDTWESTLDWMHSRFERTEVKSGAEFWTEWGGGTSVRPGWTSSGGTVTESTWDGVYPVIRMDSNPSEASVDALGFNNKFRFGESWTLNTDISFSRARNNFRNIETTAGIVGGTTDLHFSLDPGGMFYNYDFGVDLSDPRNLVIRGVADWGGQDGYYKDFNVEDKIHALRANLVRSFDSGFFSSIDFGANHTRRSKSKTDYEARLCLVACETGTDEVPFPGTVIDFGVGGIDRLAIYDADTLVAAGTWNVVDSPLDWYWGKGWEVDEKVTSLYFQANIDTDLGTMPLRGNVGVQYQRAEQSGAGYVQLSNAGLTNVGPLVSYGDKYGNVLPSMNLGLELRPELQLRFAAARQIMRPPMEWMRGGMNVSVCDTCTSTGQSIWSGGGGNPGLRPWLANAYDLSLEKYFSTKAGNRGYVGLAYFYKDLVSYLWTQTVPFDFAGFPLPPEDPTQTNYPTSTIGEMSQPANGENGSIKGLEASLSLPLDLLWAPLDGLGLVASYSDTSSGIRMNPDDPNSYPLPGLSKYVSNVSLYYERAGFSIRYNRRQRSAFVGNTRNYEGVLVLEQIDGETVQDAQVSYSFERGALEGLSLYLQVSNIGDEPFTRSLPQGPTTYWEYGRTTLAGFSYKF